MIEKLCRIPGTATVPDERTIRSFAKSVQLGDAGFVTSEALGGRGLRRIGNETAKDGAKTFRDGIRTNRIMALDGASVRFKKKTFAAPVDSPPGFLSRLVRRKDVDGLLELVRKFGTPTSADDYRLYSAEGALQSIIRASSDFETGGRTIAQAYGIVASALVGSAVGETDAGTARSVSKKAFRSLVSNFEDGRVGDPIGTSLPSLVLRTAALCDRIKNVQNKLGRMPKDSPYSFPAINSQTD